MSLALRRVITGSFSASLMLLAASASTAAPSAEDALKLAPVQKDVEVDIPAPADVARCTIKAERINGQTGWVVRDGTGQTLRRFLDTNGDNVVDQWSYYADGLEVYRDVDSTNNGKADQFRWLNTAGSRWGLDNNEDGRIDSWKSISAEEASAEAVQAMAQHDMPRFALLLLSDAELQSLGLGEGRAKDLGVKIAAAPAAFKGISTGGGAQKVSTTKTSWVSFGGSRPGIVPAGTDGSTKDVMVYENVVAMISSAGQNGQVQVGTLVKVGDVWRVVDAPQPLSEGQTELTAGGFFFRPSAANRPENGGGANGPDAQTQQLLSELEQVDKLAEAAKTPEEEAKMAAQKADLLEKIANVVTSPEERNQWLRQLADMVSAAVQSNTWPEGVGRLKTLYEELAKDPGGADMAAYVEFRYLTADYGRRLANGDAYEPVQAAWLENLKKFVADHPKGSDSAEAMLQLAIAEEFAGQEENAKKWYTQILEGFPESATAKKAGGAVTRLDSVGKPIQLRGPNAADAKTTVDLEKYAGKVVLIQYWATWCEPAKVDLAQLKELQAKYGKSGFAIISVSLDSKPEDLTEYLKTNRLPWAQIYEPGGLDSRLANEMGILTLPTMILVDKSGNVANRGIHITELDREVGNLLR